MTKMRQCSTRQAITWICPVLPYYVRHPFVDLLSKLGLSNKLLCVLCWTAQALSRRICWRQFQCLEIVNQRDMCTLWWQRLTEKLSKRLINIYIYIYRFAYRTSSHLSRITCIATAAVTAICCQASKPTSTSICTAGANLMLLLVWL